MKAIPTTDRFPWEDARLYGTGSGKELDGAIAKKLGISRSAVSQTAARALTKMRKVWRLWESVNWDERRRGEIAHRLEAIERGIL